MNLSAMQLQINIEYLEHATIQPGDSCEEDHFTNNINGSVHIPFTEYISSFISFKTISGIIPFLWQPPE
jgi:hypothetical protein